MQTKAFLVEDDALFRASMAQALSQWADVSVVGCCEDAQSACTWLGAASSAWDLAVVDLCLGDDSGLAVVAATLNRAATQHVVVLTNYATLPTREKCRALGADRVFDKATEVEDLIVYCAQLQPVPAA